MRGETGDDAHRKLHSRGEVDRVVGALVVDQCVQDATGKAGQDENPCKT